MISLSATSYYPQQQLLSENKVVQKLSAGNRPEITESYNHMCSSIEGRLSVFAHVASIYANLLEQKKAFA